MWCSRQQQRSERRCAAIFGSLLFFIIAWLSLAFSTKAHEQSQKITISFMIYPLLIAQRSTFCDGLVRMKLSTSLMHWTNALRCVLLFLPPPLLIAWSKVYSETVWRKITCFGKNWNAMHVGIMNTGPSGVCDPLHCIVIVFAFKADHHGIGKSKDTVRSTSRNRVDEEDAMQQQAEAQRRCKATRMLWWCNGCVVAVANSNGEELQ
ncbi:hypothetical protein ACFX14_003333 [Malus domestica]